MPTTALPSDARRPLTLVTGAARRVGRVIALTLARAGHDIALHHRSAEGRSREEAEATAAELRALGATVTLHAADLADEAACRALVPQVLAAQGRPLDAVVNNASTFEYDDPATFGLAALERHLRANTAPAILLAQALHGQVAARRATGEAHAQGCVVNLLDQKLVNLNPDYFSYTLSKAALQAATQMQALALAPLVRLVGVSPGVTLVSGPMSEDQFDAAHRLTPLGRSSTPEDVARAVRYAIESPAVTGSTLMVDGGQHLLGQPRDVLFLVQQQQAQAGPSAPNRKNEP
ncbi:SDR family oxidoreductase [Leptothrix discophora]|uniref:SDR family oxidoreductase n=1 Tax=Leptothrix discophora TaxID=89 RepID=A0ABT9G7G5_LEPDI|nr:SDR family oxidoreductase [Leptothrix discophora]MDP4302424.1 SDR family oxidoreductase [Leptothrix discophora]